MIVRSSGVSTPESILPFNSPPQFISRKQAAKMFGCSEQLISALVKRGILPSVKLGRAVRIDLNDLLALKTVGCQ